jgi:hypothetical protein
MAALEPIRAFGDRLHDALYVDAVCGTRGVLETDAAG